MAKTKSELQPAKWQVTATTIYCKAMKDFATILVYNDWTVKCSLYERKRQEWEMLKNGKGSSARKKAETLETALSELGSIMEEYKAMLIAEEFGSK